LAGTGKVMTAWANEVNASGGLNGHPVKVIVKDDGGNPSTALQAAKELVEQDHVMAIVGESSTADASFASYVASKGVPVVGGFSAEAPFLSNPNFFPSAANLVALLFGTAKEAKDAGKTNLGVMYCAESPICAQLVPLMQGIGKIVGIKITPEKISATAPSYTAPCLSLKGSGVDALYVANNGAVVERVVAGCAQQGYKPLQAGQGPTLTPELLKSQALAGALAAGTSANPYDTSLPVIKRLQDAVNKSYPGFTNGSEFAYDVVFPWSGAMLFEAAAKAGKLGPASTPKDVMQALYGLKNETLGGLSGPLNFTPGKPAFTPCWFTAQIKGQQLASLNANKPTCLTAAQGKQLQAALAG
jgi:branched-chain amino acid transport system substrate-binding protein